MTKITDLELNTWIELFNKKIKARFQNRKIPTAGLVLSLFNGYLYICKKHGMPADEYQIIKNALQDIAVWYYDGIDVETFKEVEPNEDRIQVEI